MKTIYVVFGTTGEYSDRRDWPVKAFVNEAKAQQLVLDATRIAKEMEAKEWRSYDSKEKNIFDPNMDMDYTGTGYYHFPVELEE